MCNTWGVAHLWKKRRCTIAGITVLKWIQPGSYNCTMVELETSRGPFAFNFLSCLLQSHNDLRKKCMETMEYLGRMWTSGRKKCRISSVSPWWKHFSRTSARSYSVQCALYSIVSYCILYVYIYIVGCFSKTLFQKKIRAIPPHKACPKAFFRRTSLKGHTT